MLTDFQNSFTVKLSSKNVMKDSLNIPPYASLLYLVKCKCQESTNNLKQMSRITINFNLIYYS